VHLVLQGEKEVGELVGEDDLRGSGGEVIRWSGEDGRSMKKDPIPKGLNLNRGMNRYIPQQPRRGSI
jgi:hypothetical protein